MNEELIQILKDVKLQWGIETVAAIKKKIEEKKLIFDKTLYNSVKIIQEENLDGNIKTEIVDYGKYLDEGVNAFTGKSWNSPYSFRGKWKGMAFFLDKWATAKGLNPYAVAFTMQNEKGLEPRKFYKSVWESRIEKDLPEMLNKAYTEYLDKTLSQINKNKPS